MIATWTVSKFANPNEVGAKLKTAPFGCIVIIMSSAVADNDAIALWLFELAKQDADFKPNPVCAGESSVPIVWQCLRRNKQSESWQLLTCGMVNPQSR